MTTPDNKPTSNDQLYEQYNPLLLAVLQDQGVPPSEIEDADQTIWSYIFSHNYLDRHGPGNQVPFRTFMIGIFYLQTQDYIRQSAAIQRAATSDGDNTPHTG
jgi:hypothetical protein